MIKLLCVYNFAPTRDNFLIKETLMNKSTKLLFLTLVLLFALVFTVSCANNNNEKGFKVSLSVGEGATILSENPLRVDSGESVTFTVEIEKGYMFTYCEGGLFDPMTNTVTVNDVDKNLNVRLYTEKYPYDPNELFEFYFKSTNPSDSATQRNGSDIPAGRLVTVTASDTARKFEGWSFNSYTSDPDSIVSTDRVFSFNISPDVARMGVVKIFANYSDFNKLVYDTNGGSVNTSTNNVKGNTHSTVTVNGDLVIATYSDEYLSFFECGSSVWDDGSFYKDGSILMEYNTKCDGSGISYSLGSKVPLVTDGDQTVLYCIWANETPENLFDVSPISMLNPASNSSYVPNWKENGVTIMGYYGNSDTVVIPETIDGKPVISISGGAFEYCDMTTLVLGKNIQKIEDGAFKKCTSLSTVYYADGIYNITNAAFDTETTAAIKHLYVNATMAPRYSGADVGGLAVKMSRLLAPTTLPKIIVIAGSSSYQGLGTEYMEALFKGKYKVINFGTTRTTHGFMYLEAMGALAGENDTVIYAPENSSYMFGERELYYKTLRDLEGMYNVYRYIDISGYTNVFSAFAELNGYRYNMAPITYESICERARESEYDANRGIINKYGDYLKSDRYTRSSTYNDAYFITLNEYIKSKNEGPWNNTGFQQANSNYLDPNNNTWCKITDPYYADSMNRVINIAKSGGASVYFSFCPVDEEELVSGANTVAWISAYNRLILDTYDFDGIVGDAADYVFASEYFYDNAFHLNDYGRTYRTYQLYVDLCKILGIAEPNTQYSVGERFDGCLFDGGTIDSPKYPTNLLP